MDPKMASPPRTDDRELAVLLEAFDRPFSDGAVIGDATAWLTVALSLREARHADWPDTAVAREVLEDLAFRMRGRRQKRRGKDAALSGDAIHPAVAESVLLRELAAAIAAAPDATRCSPERVLEIARAAPALLLPQDDGNLAFASRQLQMALAGAGFVRASRRDGTPEEETLRQLWRVHDWRPLAKRLVAEHQQPAETAGAVLALVVADGTPTDWTFVMFLALDLAERSRWPPGAHQPLIHRMFDHVAVRVAAGTIGGQVITDALEAVQLHHRGPSQFRAWLDARSDAPGAWRPTSGAMFAIAAVDATRATEVLLAKADKPHLASMIVQLSAEPLLKPAVLRRLSPAALADAVTHLPDLIVLPVAISCLAQGGPVGLAQGLRERIAAFHRGLVADVKTWTAAVQNTGSAAPTHLQVTRKAKLVWTLPLELPNRADAAVAEVSPDPLIVLAESRWRSTVRDALVVLLNDESPSQRKAFLDALGTDEPPPSRVPLDASPAFALGSATSCAVPFAGRLATNLARDAAFALGQGPAGPPPKHREANAESAWPNDAYFTLRAGAAIAAYITTVGADAGRFAAHLQARLTALAVLQHWTAIQRAIHDLWAPGPDAVLSALAVELRSFAATLTGL